MLWRWCRWTGIRNYVAISTGQYFRQSFPQSNTYPYVYVVANCKSLEDKTCLCPKQCVWLHRQLYRPYLQDFKQITYARVAGTVLVGPWLQLLNKNISVTQFQRTSFSVYNVTTLIATMLTSGSVQFHMQFHMMITNWAAHSLTSYSFLITWWDHFMLSNFSLFPETFVYNLLFYNFFCAYFQFWLGAVSCCFCTKLALPFIIKLQQQPWVLVLTLALHRRFIITLVFALIRC